MKHKGTKLLLAAFVLLMGMLPMSMAWAAETVTLPDELYLGTTKIVSGGKVQVENGTGWNYVSSTNTINITGDVTIGENDYTNKLGKKYIYSDGDLNINVASNATLKVTVPFTDDKIHHVVYSDGNMTLSGSGTINVTTTGSAAMALASNGSMTISDCNLTASTSVYAITSNNTLTIDNAVVNANGEVSSNYPNNVIINGSSVVNTIGLLGKAFTFSDSAHITVTKRADENIVSIGQTATVTLTAGHTTDYYWRTAVDGAFTSGKDTTKTFVGNYYFEDKTYFEYIGKNHLTWVGNLDEQHGAACPDSCSKKVTVFTTGKHTVGTAATCTSPAVCSVCFLTYGDSLTHNWQYTVTGNVITANCQSSQCDGGSVTITAADATYSGSAVEAQFSDALTTGATVSDITYTANTGSLTNGKPVNVGTYTASVNVIKDGNVVVGSPSVTYDITAKALPEVTLASSSGEYSGALHTIALSGLSGLTKDKDYTVTYSRNGAATDDLTNAGTITVTVTGMGNYTGTKTLTYTINPQSLASTAVSVDGTFTYNGREQTITLSGLSGLTKDKDYTVTYSRDNVPTDDLTNAGTITVTVTGMGNYDGKAETSFTINKTKDLTDIAPTGLTAVYSQKLSAVVLPDGWTWQTKDVPVGSAGEQRHTADFAGDDNHEAGSIPLTVTVAQSQTDMAASADKTEYAYGETVTITVNVAPQTQQTFGLRARLAEPAPGTISLWHGETQLTEGQTPTDGTAVFTLNTLEHGFTPGSYTLTAKYAQSGNMAEKTAPVPFTVTLLNLSDEPAPTLPDGTGDGSDGNAGEGWHSGEVIITAPDGYVISTNGGQTWGTTGTVDTSASPDGENTYDYLLREDQPDGGIGAGSVTILTDNAAPAVASVGYMADPTTAQVTFNVIETGSGVKEYALTQTSGKGEVTITDLGNFEFDLSGLTPGETYTFMFTVTDNAGHTTNVVEISITAAQLPSLPQTSDDSSMTLWLALMALAGAGLLALRRKACR